MCMMTDIAQAKHVAILARLTTMLRLHACDKASPNILEFMHTSVHITGPEAITAQVMTDCDCYM